jgi:hypothetical protein
MPKYVLLVPLLWSLIAIPSDLALGVYEDIGMVVASIVGTVWLVWRDRVSTRQTTLAGLALLALVAFTGNNDVLLGLGLILLVATVAQETVAHRGGGIRPPAPPRELPLAAV